ncbi:MAG: hypothetical protein J0I86_04440, partial [Mesorhizobium sp.]|nr:hypothetical protein [Mesorhizobium sp.]
MRQRVVGAQRTKNHCRGDASNGKFSGTIEDLPSLSIPLGAGTLEFSGSSSAFYYLTCGLTIAGYLLLRGLVNSRFGIALTAIREDADRTESLGCNVRLLQLVTFGIAGLQVQTQP